MTETTGGLPSGGAAEPSGPAAPGPVPVSDPLGYLAGTWHVERTVRDAASGTEGTFTGTTVFAPLRAAPGAGGPAAPTGESASPASVPSPSDDDRSPAGKRTPASTAGRTTGDPGTGQGLVSQESGTFIWQGTARPAERALRFLPGEHPGTVRVEFADGRPFHDLDLTSGHHVAHHPCAADRYRGEFTVLGPDRWRTVWRVVGPAKDQLLVTEYTRRRTARAA